MRSFVGAARAKQPLKGPSGFSEGSQGRRAPGWLPSPGDPSALCAPSSDISAVSTHLGVAAKGALGRPESQVTPCVKPCVLPVSLRVRTRVIMRLHAGAAPSLGPSASPIPYPVVLAFSLVCTPPQTCANLGLLHVLFPLPGMLFPAGSTPAHSLTLGRSQLKCHLLKQLSPSPVPSWGSRFPHSPYPQLTHHIPFISPLLVSPTG